MTEKILIKDLQKQDPSSQLIELFELEYASGVFAYFSPHGNNTTSLQFRDYTTPSTIRTYTKIPINATNFERKIAGSASRPTFTIANITNTFSSAVGDIDYTKLLGLKLIRRTTLKKYLYGESADSNPPIEYPREVYYIERMTQRTKEKVIFEMAAPFDLKGITLPNRNIIANRCPWLYQGAGNHLDSEGFKKAQSGCIWNLEGKYRTGNGEVGSDGTVTEYTLYVNQDDEYIIPSTTTFTTYSSSLTGLNPDGYLKTTASAKTRINPDGTTTSTTPTLYWQINASAGTNQAGSAIGTPSDTNTKVNSIRVFSTWAADTDYHTFVEDDRLNSYVKHTDDVATSPTNGKTLIWKAKKPSRNVKPTHGEFWERGDLCSKSINGCKRRFGFVPITASSATSTAKADPLTNVVLPFGGFPGAKGFS